MELIILAPTGKHHTNELFFSDVSSTNHYQSSKGEETFMKERLGSVKAAIDLYKGNSAMNQSSNMKSLEKPYPRTSQLHIARRDMGRLDESRKVAEVEKAQAETELLNARKMVKELSSRIEELNSRLSVQNQDLEKLKAAKRGGNWGMALRNPQNNQHSKVISELGYAKEELIKLKQDMASIIEEKRRAEQEIETSSLKMQSFSSKVEELRKEVEELNEELVIVELARIEAIKEFREIEAQRREDTEKHSAAMKENRKKIDNMVQEIQISEELQEKLASTTSDVQVLQSELKQVREMDRWNKKNESLRFGSDFLEKDLSLLQSLKEDLGTAKSELASIKGESFQFMASMDVVRNELKRISEESDRLKKKGSKADLTIQNLNTKLVRAKSKLEAASDNEGKATSITSSLLLSLEQLTNEAEEAEKERMIAIEEAAKVKEEIQKTQSETVLAEERWEAAIQELETIKLSEATVLSNLKRLADVTMKSRASASTSTLTISRFEYEYLKGRAGQAVEIADKKVEAAEAWVKALQASENEISMKTEIVRKEIQELKMEEEQKGLKMEHSPSVRMLVDMQLQKWEEIHGKNLEQLHRKSNSISGKMTSARRAKFRKSASPAPRTPRAASFAVRRRRKNGSSQRSETSAGFSQLFLPLIAHKKQQGRMRDAQPGPHTVRSHGMVVASHTLRSHGITVARTHLNDWLILILLLAIVVLLNAIHPFYRFVGKDMMEDLKYPLKSNTVPIWAVPVYSVLLPMVVFLLLYFRRKDVYDLHHAILGLLFSVLVTAVITGAIKDAVGRPRPDFFWCCFPDGKEVYDQWGDVVCHGDKNVVKEGHKSFPSGHTSLSFAGLGFLSLYLSGKIQVFDCRGHVAKLCLVLLPLLLASLVAISRVDDYWHHWQDVFAGGLIGLVVAALCYLQFFPPPYHDQGWATYAYFRAIEESQGTAEAASGENCNANNTRSAEVQIACRQNERNNNSCTGISLSGDSGPNVEDLESGSR